MFTGIVKEIGRVEMIESDQRGARLDIACDRSLSGLQVGDSIAVNGVCLTAEECRPDSFRAAASPETLRLTNLGCLKAGDEVHLEPSLKALDSLGGHWVQGHVDGAGVLDSSRREGDSLICRFQAPKHILDHCVYKGSIAVDGVSLTITAKGDGWFETSLIPHTLEATRLGALKSGDRVNLENDVISKYVEAHVERLLRSGVGDRTRAGRDRVG